MGEWRQFPAGELEEPDSARVAVLLGRALLAVTMAYEQRSPTHTPLALAANTLRVIEDGGTPLSKLHTLSGTSPETASSQCTALTKLFGFAQLVNDSTRRGKLLQLTPTGRKAQAAHARRVEETERAIDGGVKAASALRRLLAGQHSGDLAIRAALTPPPAGRRSGKPSGAAAARPSVDARDREMVAQTESFLADPFGALPRYPVWEATRGFGP